MKTAVVLGGTGLVGSSLLKKLASDKSFSQIVALVRNRKNLSDPVFSNPKIRLLEFKFENWNELEVQITSYLGTQTASFFCCLGTTLKKAGSPEAFKKVDHDYVVSFAKLAKACHAEHLIVVSALGADKHSKIFYNQVKGEMEADVQSKFNGKLHFLRPSLLLGDRNEFRFGERMAILLAPVYTPLLFGSLSKYQPIRADQVAKVMHALATKKFSAEMVVENETMLKL